MLQRLRKQVKALELCDAPIDGRMRLLPNRRVSWCLGSRSTARRQPDQAQSNEKGR